MILLTIPLEEMKSYPSLRRAVPGFGFGEKPLSATLWPGAKAQLTKFRTQTTSISSDVITAITSMDEARVAVWVKERD